MLPQRRRCVCAAWARCAAGAGGGPPSSAATASSCATVTANAPPSPPSTSSTTSPADHPRRPPKTVPNLAINASRSLYFSTSLVCDSPRWVTVAPAGLSGPRPLQLLRRSSASKTRSRRCRSARFDTVVL